MSKIKIGLSTKLDTLREIRERYKFLIKAENNTSRRELYIKWKQEEIC